MYGDTYRERKSILSEINADKVSISVSVESPLELHFNDVAFSCNFMIDIKDTVSSKGSLLLFKKERELVDSKDIAVVKNTFMSLDIPECGNGHRLNSLSSHLLSSPKRGLKLRVKDDVKSLTFYVSNKSLYILEIDKNEEYPSVYSCIKSGDDLAEKIANIILK